MKNNFLILRKYIIKSISGEIKYPKNIDDCYKLMSDIENEISKMFPNIKKYSYKPALGRMMNVKEINGIVKYLCSNESSYCTGAQFVLDGGYTL